MEMEENRAVAALHFPLFLLFWEYCL